MQLHVSIFIGFAIYLIRSNHRVTGSPLDSKPSGTPEPLSSVPLRSAPCLHPTVTAEQFAKTKFDYIIIGSGAGGLPLAARLAQDPSVTVGVIEAGLFHREDDVVNIPGFGGRGIGNSSYDWLFSTIPQTNVGERVIQEPRGKMLGGSTGLNLLAWDRASKAEYDSWDSFFPDESSSSSTSSNHITWDFDSLLPHFRKSESVDLAFYDTLPGLSKDEYHKAKAEMERGDGSSGPVQVSYNSVYTDLADPYVSAWNNLNVSTNPYIFIGNTAGIRNNRHSTGDGVRSYAATAYYCPMSTRKNFHVLTAAQLRLISMLGSRVASYELPASRLSISVVPIQLLTGRSLSPLRRRSFYLLEQFKHLLELSGIGDASVLAPLGVKSLIDLPGVGTNLQDHIFAISQFTAANSLSTFDKLRYNKTFAAEQMALYSKNHTGFLTATGSALTYLPANASVWPRSEVSSLIKELKNILHRENHPLLNHIQYQTQLEWLQNSNVPQTEIISQFSGLVDPAENTNYLSMFTVLLHPLSRGTIHISDTDPLAPPAIDPNYLNYDYDLQTLRAAVDISLAVAKQAPLSDLLISQQYPPANLRSKSEKETYIRTTFSTGGHLAGTAAMASRSLGGVVDSSLKVYGTSNLRVVDASVIPILVGAHLQATIYAISERATDIIRRGL